MAAHGFTEADRRIVTAGHGDRGIAPPGTDSVRPAGLRVMTTKVALQLPAELAYEDWERAGRQLSELVSSSSWWLGDWLIYGKDHYRNRYERGVQAAGLRYQTLRNYAWIAGRFPPGRRRPSLAFRHHAELAALTVEEQDRWLDLAQTQSWTIQQLRSALRDARGGTTKQAVGPASVQRLALPAERLQRWLAAAAQTGTDVEAWAIEILDNAAEEILTD